MVSPAPSDLWETLRRRAAETDWTPWLIVALGAFLRFFLLGIKPPHFDEGINGWFVDQMVKNGFYRYDPTNYHGPLHFYILFVCQTLLGRNIWALRLPVVLASIFSIHLTLKFEPFVGRNVSRWAALAMAVSPGFVFYGRYSIHEVWLLVFSMLFILGLLGLWKRGTVDYLWCAGMGVTGMILTKETYIIHAACAALAAVVCYISRLLFPTEESQAGTSREIFRTGPLPVLRNLQLPLSLHFLASFCLGRSAFVSPDARGYLLFLATIGFVTAFLVPMELLYGKSEQRQALPVISFRWLTAFLFSIFGQVMFLLPTPWDLLMSVPKLFDFLHRILGQGVVLLPGPWNFFVWAIGPVGVVLALRFIRSDRVFIVHYRGLDLAVVLGVGLAAIIFFYSGCFMNWPGVTGLWKTFEAWFKTGTQGAGHEKPYYYWLQLIARYEHPVLFALFLAPLILCIRNLSVRYLAIYGTGALVAYSVVAYKTPWCIISIVWPLLFLFAAGPVVARGTYEQISRIGAKPLLRYLIISIIASGLVYRILGFKEEWAVYKTEWFLANAVCCLLVIFAVLLFLATALHEGIIKVGMATLLAVSLGFCVTLNYFRCSTFNEYHWNADRTVPTNVSFFDWEPYVYVQTYNDVWKLTKPLLRLAKSNPSYYQLVGHLIRTSTYPLPWMLGDFTKVGYYEHNNMPEKVDGDFLLVQEDKIAEVESKLHDTYYTELMTIRPYQDYSKLYFNAKTFSKLFPGRVPEFTGHPSPNPEPPK